MAVRLTFALLAACLLALPACAQDSDLSPEAKQRADWGQRLEAAKDLQKKGAAMQNEAKEVFEKRKTECFKKFRVNDCQDKAKHQFNQANIEARRIENEGKAQERKVKKEELADKDARRLARDPERQAELQAREADTRAQREHDEASRAARLADKEEKAEQGARRRAAAEERQRQKQEKHDRMVAEKMGKARQQEQQEGEAER